MDALLSLHDILYLSADHLQTAINEEARATHSRPNGSR